MTNDTEKALQELEDVRNLFSLAIEKDKQRYNEKWNALSSEDQIDFFCAIMQRVHLGELEQKRSYRGVLYDVFGWGPEAYVPAQCAGYLDIHNMIFDAQDIRGILKKFAIEYLGKEDNEDLVKTLDKFLWDRYA